MRSLLAVGSSEDLGLAGTQEGQVAGQGQEVEVGGGQLLELLEQG